VTHNKNEFTKMYKIGNKKRLAGTQCIDAKWRWMKLAFPCQTKNRTARHVNGKIFEFCFSYQFRANLVADGLNLWTALGDETRQAKCQ
jgi:hypothetical protein